MTCPPSLLPPSPLPPRMHPNAPFQEKIPPHGGVTGFDQKYHRRECWQELWSRDVSMSDQWTWCGAKWTGRPAVGQWSVVSGDRCDPRCATDFSVSGETVCWCCPHLSLHHPVSMLLLLLLMMTTMMMLATCLCEMLSLTVDPAVPAAALTPWRAAANL